MEDCANLYVYFKGSLKEKFVFPIGAPDYQGLDWWTCTQVVLILILKILS